MFKLQIDVNKPIIIIITYRRERMPSFQGHLRRVNFLDVCSGLWAILGKEQCKSDPHSFTPLTHPFQSLFCICIYYVSSCQHVRGISTYINKNYPPNVLRQLCQPYQNIVDIEANGILGYTQYETEACVLSWLSMVAMEQINWYKARMRIVHSHIDPAVYTVGSYNTSITHPMFYWTSNWFPQC